MLPLPRTSRSRHWLLLLVVPALVVATELWWRATTAEESPDTALLASRIVVEYQNFGEVVRYAYLGAPLPEKLTDDEVVGMRTESSYSRLITIDDETARVENVSYPQRTFARSGGGEWHYVEYATTTPTLFFNRSALHATSYRIVRAVLPLVYAVTDTIYAGAGDGYIEASGGGLSHANSWNTAHDATAGTVSYLATSAFVSAQTDLEEFNCEPPPTYIYTIYIDRAFLPFDSSSIPANASISSATLNVYVTSKTNDDNDGVDYITVVQTDQASHSSLATGDYNNAGSVDNPTEGVDSGQRKDITSISTSAYLSFTLNSTGLGWIKKNGEDAPCSTTNGISCFGLREGHDTTDALIDAPATPDECNFTTRDNEIVFSTSETTGTSQDPYLSITYTVPAAEIKRYNVIWID